MVPCTNTKGKYGTMYKYLGKYGTVINCCFGAVINCCFE